MTSVGWIMTGTVVIVVIMIAGLVWALWKRGCGSWLSVDGCRIPDMPSIPEPPVNRREDRALDDGNQAMRLASGEVSSRSQLVAFLYVLMRDALAIGAVEDAFINAVELTSEEKAVFTNGWLANYAKYLASRLQPTSDLAADPAEASE